MTKIIPQQRQETLKEMDHREAIIINNKLNKRKITNSKLVEEILKGWNQPIKKTIETEQDYTEVAWLKVLTQDLDKPTCPQIKLLKEWEPHKECCCWELEYEWEIYYQYDLHWYIKEVQFRWLKPILDEQWTILEKELWPDWLKKLLWLKGSKDYKGYRSGGTCNYRGSYAYYWSSSVYTPSPTNSWRRVMYYSVASVTRGNGTQTHGFSVRCLKD